MPLQGEYAPSSAEWVRNQVEEIESSGGTRGTVLRGMPVIVITSVGHGSGKLRKNPVMRVEHDGKYAAVASKGGAPEHPTWYRNLVEHPLVEVQDGAVQGRLHRPRGERRRARGVVGAGRGRVARLRRLPGEDRPRDPGVRAGARELTARA